jgi:peroxiredoxin
VQLHNARKQFDEKGFQVVLAGLGMAEQAENFRAEFDLSFPIICDPQKDLYGQFGLGRGGVFSLASPAVLLRGMRAMSRGYTPGIPRGDVMQMPGVFLIDTEGNIRYSYFSKDISDHPPIDALLELNNLFK